MSEIRPFYVGDVMLLNWSETAKGGRNVVFLLDAEGTEHPFRSVKIRSGGKSKSATHGQQFKIVLVAIDENGAPMDLATGERPASNEAVPDKVSAETPTEPAQRPNDLPIKAARHLRDMPRSQQAALKCQDLDFQHWVRQFDTDDPDDRSIAFAEPDGYLKRVLRITSKRELDTDKAAGERWDKMLATYDYRGRA